MSRKIFSATSQSEKNLSPINLNGCSLILIRQHIHNHVNVSRSVCAIRDVTTVYVPTNEYSTMFVPCVLCINVKFYSCINFHFGEGNATYLKNKMFEFVSILF